jgi:hypothetical protein
MGDTTLVGKTTNSKPRITLINTKPLDEIMATHPGRTAEPGSPCSFDIKEGFRKVCPALRER